MSKSQVVIYRIGGTERFEWRRSVPMGEIEARAALDRVLTQGYAAFIEDAALSESIGLPETYDAPPLARKKGA